MKTRFFCLLFGLTLIGCVSYFTASKVRPVWSRIIKSEPDIDYPTLIDLGDHELGDQVVRDFTISNRGGGELVIDRIRSSCSCAGIERVEGDHFVQIDSLRLEAGEATRLVIRVSVRNVPVGMAMHNFVEFHTSDPNHPVCRIEAIVARTTGGISTAPGEMLFGTVPAGARVNKVVDVRDTMTPPRAIKMVTVSEPDRITIRLLPEADIPSEPTPDPSGRIIGRLEIGVRTEQLGEVSAEARIQLSDEGRPPDIVHITGKVAPPFALSPSSLVLPRATAEKPVYEAKVICISTFGKPFTLTVEHSPRGVAVSLSGEKDPCCWSARVVWDPQVWKPGSKEVAQTIRFKVVADGRVEVLELMLYLQG